MHYDSWEAIVELKSSIYECRVAHHRFEPKKHHFSHRIFMFSLALNEMDKLDGQLGLLSHNRFNLFSFYDRDHLDKDDRPTQDKLMDYLTQSGMDLDGDHQVQLITLPRIAGYIFNPVSFYFISDANSRPVCAVAEVSNTYREMKTYLLTKMEKNRFRLRIPKHFYVSPFSSLELEFDFNLGLPGDKMDIYIDEYEGNRKILASSLRGEARPFSNRRLFWYAIKYPLLTLKVITQIHWHALRLKLKGLEHHSKAENPQLQKDLVRQSKPKKQTVCQ